MTKFVVGTTQADTVTTHDAYRVKPPMPAEILREVMADAMPPLSISKPPKAPGKLARILETVRAYAANEEPDFE